MGTDPLGLSGRMQQTIQSNPILGALSSLGHSGGQTSQPPQSIPTPQAKSTTPGVSAEADYFGQEPTTAFRDAEASGKSFAADAASIPSPKAQDKTPSRSSGSGHDMAALIRETAEDIGADPEDLATLISYETGGTFSPTQGGPITQHGKHRGLIQFGEPQARRFGVDWNDPIGSQLGRGKAISRYMKASGYRPGMSGLDLYSTVNAGSPGRYGARDAHVGGAPGDVRDKWENQMAGHRAKARALLGGGSGPVNVASGVEVNPAQRYASRMFGDVTPGEGEQLQAERQGASSAPAAGGGGGGMQAQSSQSAEVGPAQDDADEFLQPAVQQIAQARQTGGQRAAQRKAALTARVRGQRSA